MAERRGPRPRAALRELTGIAVVAVAILVPGFAFIEVTAPSVPGQRKPPVVDVDTSSLPPVPEYAGAIPVLNFHDVSDRPGRYTVTPVRFAEHIAALDAAGFETVGLAEVRALLSGAAVELPPRPLLITFDDGAASNWRVADPILARHGFGAVAFLITNHLTDRHGYYLTVGEARSMARSGRWELGAHTHDLHGEVLTALGEAPALINRTVDGGAVEALSEWRERVRADLLRNRRSVEGVSGLPAIAFAYPFSARRVPTNDERIPGVLRALIDERFELAFGDRDPFAPAIHAGADPLALSRLTALAGQTPAGAVQMIVDALPTVPARDFGLADWIAGDGRCDARPGRVRVRGSGYVTCTVRANSSTWQELTFATKIAGVSRRSGATIRLAESPHGRIELTVGESAAVLTEVFEGHRTEVARVARDGDPVAVVRTRLGRASITVAVDGTRTTVKRDPRLAGGGLALAANLRRPGGITFTEPRLDLSSTDRS